MEDKHLQDLLQRVDEHFAHKEVVASRVFDDIRQQMKKDRDESLAKIAEYHKNQAEIDDMLAEWKACHGSLPQALQTFNDLLSTKRVAKYVFYFIVSISAMITAGRVIYQAIFK